MKRVLLLAVLVALTLTTQVIAGEYAHTIEEKKMSFSWSVDGPNLLVKISAKTKGWVGIGFNPSKKMKDADFVLGYVKKGKAKITDEFGTADKKHKSDEKLGTKNDAVLLGGTEENGVTTIEFSIPLSSGDAHDTDIDTVGDTIVLLAYGGSRDSFISTHKYRSTFKVNLGTGSFEKM